MEDSGKKIRVSLLWKGNKYSVEIDSGASLKDLGYELRKLTGVTSETLRLIVPRLNEKGSSLMLPFSDEHSSLSLQESNIIEVSLCFFSYILISALKSIFFIVMGRFLLKVSGKKIKVSSFIDHELVVTIRKLRDKLILSLVLLHYSLRVHFEVIDM
jgi:hypothetical protein